MCRRSILLNPLADLQRSPQQSLDLVMIRHSNTLFRLDWPLGHCQLAISMTSIVSLHSLIYYYSNQFLRSFPHFFHPSCFIPHDQHIHTPPNLPFVILCHHNSNITNDYIRVDALPVSTHTGHQKLFSPLN